MCIRDSLVITYPASFVLVVCLIVLGLAFEHHWHYMVLATFSAAQCAAIMVVTVAINAYLLDCYPDSSGDVSAWVSTGRILGGFMATYIQLPWLARDGVARTLGIQAGVTGVAVLITVFLQVYGQRLRRR